MSNFAKLENPAVSSFFKLIIPEERKAIFNRHADSKQHLKKNDFAKALLELGIDSDGAESEETFLDDLFLRMDIDGSGGLDWEEFERLTQSASTCTEKWAETIPLYKLLGRCIPKGGEGNALRAITRLSLDQTSKLKQDFLSGFEKLWDISVQNLKKTFELMDQKLKDQTDGTVSKFTYIPCVGTIEDFHKGLKERIGAPYISDVGSVMRKEHCVKGGCMEQFVTTNYGVQTWAAREWGITVDGQPCPEHDKKKHRKGGNVRIIKSLPDLKRVKAVEGSKLSDDEIIAVVLYTGPMFQVYNTILREFPRFAVKANGETQPFPYYEFFKQAGNLFVTTIFVLASAVQKVAREMKIPPGLKLYRGLGGDMELPEHFYRTDQHGCRGYVDWAFLSTTSSKAAAIQYSGVMEKKALPALIEMTTGSVDRGADIQAFSQYPEEAEYLWVPCSFLEPSGSEYQEITSEGLVSVVPVRMNANLNARTLEELKEERRKMHLASFKFLLEEMKRDIGGMCDDLQKDPSVMSYTESIMMAATQAYDRHSNLQKYSADVFNDDISAKGLSVELLEIRNLHSIILRAGSKAKSKLSQQAMVEIT